MKPPPLRIGDEREMTGTAGRRLGPRAPATTHMGCSGARLLAPMPRGLGSNSSDHKYHACADAHCWRRDRDLRSRERHGRRRHARRLRGPAGRQGRRPHHQLRRLRSARSRAASRDRRQARSSSPRPHVGRGTALWGKRASRPPLPKRSQGTTRECVSLTHADARNRRAKQVRQEPRLGLLRLVQSSHAPPQKRRDRFAPIAVTRCTAAWFRRAPSPARLPDAALSCDSRYGG
jgi:hypothetical protein